MNFIVDPVTYNKHSIFSKDGILLLKNYVKLYQSGGTSVQYRLGGMSVVSGRKQGDPCPIYKYLDEDGNEVSKYLAISGYNEIEAEKLGYNPLLINEEITKFLYEQTEPTIMTWVILVNPQEPDNETPIGQIPTKELFTLVAVHNESFYEFSAKHDTIITRILSNEKGRFPNIGPNPYFASGELMFVPEEPLFFNLQSGTYFTNVVQQKGDAYNLEAAKSVGPGFWLKELLQFLGELKYEKETFISEQSYISPKYIEKLEELQTRGLVKFSLAKNKNECNIFTKQITIITYIDTYKKRINGLKETLKKKEGSPMYDTYKQIYGRQINRYSELMNKEKKKLGIIGIERVLKGNPNKHRKSKTKAKKSKEKAKKSKEKAKKKQRKSKEKAKS